MMNKFLLLILCGLCISLAIESEGATITAVSSGSWLTNSTWSCNCQPTNADNVIIPAGITVSITTAAVFLSGGPVITVTIYGTLALINAGSLVVDSTDIIKVMAGGKITGTGPFDGIWSGLTPIFVPNGTSIPGPSTISAGLLPITLLFFKGQARGRSVLLEWASASEKNLDVYAVSKSIDGTHFEEVAKIKGACNSTQRLEYVFEDTQPFSGVAYYRLQSVDLDGAIETFDLIMVEFKANDRAFEVFPNPVIGNALQAKLNFYGQEGDQITVYDSQGSMVVRQVIRPAEVRYAFELPPAICKGLYFVTVKTKAETFTATLVVD
jgi:hypothetical protein